MGYRCVGKRGGGEGEEGEGSFARRGRRWKKERVGGKGEGKGTEAVDGGERGGRVNGNSWSAALFPVAERRGARSVKCVNIWPARTE